MFKRKEVPCICRWTPKGSIDGSILLYIVKTLAILDVYKIERKQGMKPMIFVDAHGSRVDLKFLEHINAPETEWCVRIGVSYEILLWKIGDSS